MGSHERLGEKSLIRMMDRDLLEKIVRPTRSPKVREAIEALLRDTARQNT
mgnify:CR=1 FL=1